MENKYIVKELTTIKLEVEKSKFIGIIFPIESLADFQNTLETFKQNYPKANHYCYAYIYENTMKSSDNGEPSGTAGKPILNVLESNNLINTAIVVVRYFGGTLLGAGRLTRTYLRTAQEAFKNSIKCKLVEKIKVRVTLEIETYDIFLSFLKKMHYCVIKTLFNDKIVMDFLADTDFKKESLNMFLNKVEFVAAVPYLLKTEVNDES